MGRAAAWLRQANRGQTGYLRGAAGTSAVGGRPVGGGGGRPAGRPAGGGHHAKRWTRWLRFQFQSGRRENARQFKFHKNGSFPEFRSPPLEEQGGKSREEGKPFSEK